MEDDDDPLLNNPEDMRRTGFIDSSSFSLIGEQLMRWPFVAFSSFKGYLCLYSAFDASYINFIQIPDSKKYKISRIFITETY
jgi:hypothetical protein